MVWVVIVVAIGTGFCCVDAAGMPVCLLSAAAAAAAAAAGGVAAAFAGDPLVFDRCMYVSFHLCLHESIHVCIHDSKESTRTAE